MSVVDEVLTRYRLEDAYSVPARRIAKATDDIAQAHNRAKNSNRHQKTDLDDLSKAADYLQDSYGTLTGAATAAVGAYVAVVGAVAAGSYDAMKRAAEWDALVAALKAVEGNAESAERALVKVREAARAPGLGQREAISGYTKLRRSGLDEELSLSLLREFGNANASGGGGKAELDQLLTAVSQIANKPFLQGDELLQLTEGGIPAFKLIKDIFGTTDTEELKKRGIESIDVLRALNSELAKMPRVAGGAKNSFENVADAVDYAMVTAGQAINRELLPFVDAMGNSIDKGAEAGLFESIGQQIAESLITVLGTDDTDRILTEAVIELRTIVHGITQLTLNLQGAWDLFTKINSWTNPSIPFANAVDKWRGGDGDAITGGDSIFELREKWRNEAEMAMELAEKRRDKARNQLAQTSTPSAAERHAREIAQNTRELVQIQQRREDFERAMLGGGERSRSDMNLVAIGGATRGYRGRRFAAVVDALGALFDEMERAPQRYALDQARMGA